MGCPELTERDYSRLRNCTEKTAYSRFSYTVTDDQIGNRKTYDTTESGSNVQSVYSANSLNQYTSIGSMGSTWSPTHDDDGNMLTMDLASGEWSATYNGENRLAAIENSSKRLEFSYDYMGRRVEKKVYSGSVGNWVLDEHSRFVYDGYLQIEKLDALNSNAVIRKRIWSDGKVICDIHGSTAYYALGDANKNITEYIDSTGAIQAHFEFSPFGKITVASCTDPDDFDFRFSSEVFEHETGLVYYNYRYYSPELGRWLSRDPIGENGGENLYGMVWNSPLSLIDYIGLFNLIFRGKWDPEEKKQIELIIDQLEIKTRQLKEDIEKKIKEIEDCEECKLPEGLDDLKRFLDRLNKMIEGFESKTQKLIFEKKDFGGRDTKIADAGFFALMPTWVIRLNENPDRGFFDPTVSNADRDSAVFHETSHFYGTKDPHEPHESLLENAHMIDKYINTTPNWDNVLKEDRRYKELIRQERVRKLRGGSGGMPVMK